MKSVLFIVLLCTCVPAEQSATPATAAAYLQHMLRILSLCVAHARCRHTVIEQIDHESTSCMYGWTVRDFGIENPPTRTIESDL